MSRQTTVVARLEEHPNLAEIVGVLAQLPHVEDAALLLLAQAWVNSPALAVARSHALHPDSPLVLDALAAFEAVTALFADDLLGAAAYVTVDRDITRLALKAVRDAIAAAYAQPVLTRRDHDALLRPWRLVYPVATVDEPDLGPSAEQVKALLSGVAQLAQRCHDADGRRVFDALLDRSFVAEADRATAVASAFDAAVLTQRRRLWTLVRRTGAQGLSQACPSCRAPQDAREVERVLALCLDAACALLVADALSDADAALLTSPISLLVPAQRRAEPSS